MKLSKSQNSIRKDRANMKAWYYQLQDLNKTVAYAELNGVHGERIVGKNPRVYFIIEGKGEFIINGKKISVSAKDVIPIPAHATYNFHALGGNKLKFVVFLDELLDLSKIPSK